VVIDDTGVFNQRLREWEDFHNFNRPHRSLGGQTPHEKLRETTRGSV
jgi:transposase InsO family protein